MVTFLSAESQNKLIVSMANKIFEKVQEERGIKQIHGPQRFQPLDGGRFKNHLRTKDVFNCFLDTLQQCQSSNESRETVIDAEAPESKILLFG